MKIYTNTIDLTNPAPKQFWVAPYSDFGIGIKFVNGINAVEGEISLTDNKGNTLTAAENKYGDGFTVFNVTSGEKDSDVIYTAIAPNGQKVLITQNVSDSTVFDVSEGGGELPSEVEFTNLKTEELSASTIDTSYIHASDTITATTIDTESLEAYNIDVHYKVTTEEASTGNLTAWNDVKVGNIVEASQFNGYYFSPAYSAIEGIMNNAPTIAFQESQNDNGNKLLYGTMAGDWQVDHLTSNFDIQAFDVKINNELRFTDYETGEDIILTVNDIKQLLQLINQGA